MVSFVPTGQDMFDYIITIYYDNLIYIFLLLFLIFETLYIIGKLDDYFYLEEDKDILKFRMFLLINTIIFLISFIIAACFGFFIAACICILYELFIINSKIVINIVIIIIGIIILKYILFMIFKKFHTK